MFNIRQIMGAFCGGAGTLFLVINAGILARGAAKWGFEAWEKASYGAVAATVPFVIAAMPFLISLSWKPKSAQEGRRFGRPSLLTAIGCGIWLVFVAYNLAGAAGSIALVRDDVVSMRKHLASNFMADQTMQSRITGELNDVPRHRPIGTVAPMLAAKKAAPEWERTEKCTDIRRPKDTKFCSEIASLESELASGKRAQELTQQLSSLNAKIEAKPATSEKADPAARIISSLTGWDEDYVSERLPLATPIVLELGSMTLIYFSFVLMGFGSHRSVLERPVARTAPALPKQAYLPPASQQPTLTRQRELAEWFFRECVRPANAGAMPEAAWYRHYQEVCHQHNDSALPLASFRRFAEKCECLDVKDLDGVTHYVGALPYVPRRAA